MNIHTGEPASQEKGSYQVATPFHETPGIADADLTPGLMRQHHAQIAAHEISADPETFAGYWRETERPPTWTGDSSITVKGRSAAFEQGKQWRQKAAWDNHRNTEVWMSPPGRPLGSQPHLPYVRGAGIDENGKLFAHTVRGNARIGWTETKDNVGSPANMRKPKLRIAGRS